MIRTVYVTVLLGLAVVCTNAMAQESLSQVIGAVKQGMQALQEQQGVNPDKARALKQQIAQYVIRTVDNRVTNCNDPRDGLARKCFSLSSARERFSTDQRSAALWAWQNGAGKCNEHASLVYLILKEAGAGDDLRMIADADKSDNSFFDNHAFVVWGVEKGAKLHDPASWGKDAIAVDAWRETVTSGYQAGKEIVDKRQTPTDLTQERTSNKKPWMIPTDVKATQLLNDDIEAKWRAEHMANVSFEGNYQGQCKNGFKGGGKLRISVAPDKSFSGKLMGQLRGNISGQVANDGGMYFAFETCKFYGGYYGNRVGGRLQCTGSGGCKGGWSAK